MKKLSLFLAALLLIAGTTAVFAWSKDSGVSCQNVFAKIQNDNLYRYADESDGFVKYVRTETEGDGNSDWEWQVGPVESDIAANEWLEVNWTPPAGWSGDVEVLAAIYKDKEPQYQNWDEGKDFEDSKKDGGHLDCPPASPSPEPSSSPSPSPSPESSPEPGEQIVLELGIDGPKCNEGHFHLAAYPKKNGVVQSGVKVEFWYNGITKYATTASPAEVDFDFQGNGKVTAKADGYPTAEVGVESKKNCGVGGAPEILGAATSQGQVLGAMAETGNPIVDLFNLVFGLGAGLIGAGVKRYAQKTK